MNLPLPEELHRQVVEALQCAQNVLILLRPEVIQMGANAKRVPDKVHEALNAMRALPSTPPSTAEGEKDAERYRWLRSQSDVQGLVEWMTGKEFETDAEMDAVIDARIEAERTAV